MDHETPKALNKSFNSLDEMLKDSGAEEELLNAVKDVRNQQVTHTLAKMRVAKGFTQKQMAELVGCTQGWISKLETGRDEDLRLKDVLDYARATDTGVQIGIGPQLNHVQAIKYLVFALKRHLDELIKLANGDDAGITKGIVKFFDQVVFNVAFRLGQCAKALQNRKEATGPEIEVISSGEVDDLQEFGCGDHLKFPQSPRKALAAK
jgi:transcriptional regulator with XRE-family HTH domain